MNQDISYPRVSERKIRLVFLSLLKSIMSSPRAERVQAAFVVGDHACQDDFLV